VLFSWEFAFPGSVEPNENEEMGMGAFAERREAALDMSEYRENLEGCRNVEKP
jgi:hypothetical protein